VFASDLYSLGVTMYQMLTGVLPYETPSPADLERLMRGDLVAPPRVRNSAIPKGVSDIVMRAMAPEIGVRYQRASDLLTDLLAVRPTPPRRPTTATPTPVSDPAAEEIQSIHRRLRAREAPASRFCWNCRKPLPARSGQCPFCGESQ